ncbi:MAG: hypothetical protein JWM67_1558 [Mycobacterium sp.]|jgi:glycosyltransferase involved in cell wall biosynthesis|nr:hypothetical protein [Mycobacterium sp.]
MAAGTIIAANYVGMARVLAESFQRHHPGHPFFTLLIDGTEGDRRLPGLGTVLLPSDLDLPLAEWQEMAAGYSVMELATAAKPALLLHLLELDRTATYLDPDIRVFEPLQDCFEAAERSSIALIPHCLLPVPRDGRETSERTLMLAGIFNLGFISVGQRSRPFLRWWHERLRHDAISDVANGLFTDQRWVDWVPSLFEHTVLRDPGLNVAYWNLHERPLTRTALGRVTAGGVPLRFFHFSGFDPERPWVLSKHGGANPRLPLSEQPVVEELCAEYADALAQGEYAEFRRRGYGLDLLPNGVVLTAHVRRLVRAAYVDPQQRDAVRNPYADPVGFVAWLGEPVRGTLAFPLSRLETSLWEMRSDLRDAFPDIDGRDAAGFRDWLDNDAWALAEGAVVPTVRPVGQPLARGDAPAGWSLIAYADAELGVGEAGRRLALAAGHIGLPTEVVGVGGHLSRRQHQHGLDVQVTPRYANSVSCVNADQLPRVWAQLGLDGPRHGSRVALCFWEVDRVPEPWRPALGMLDQLWVASEYTRDVFDRLGLCRVELITLPVPPPAGRTPHTRRSLGLPEDKFVFTCSYDFLSVLRRKNPLDVIAAYTAAFGPDDGAALVLKSINGHHRPEDLARVRRAAGRRADIHVLDGYRTGGQMRGMLELSDCVVSLHRSEGYGLNLADAMARGTPVLATGFSGNMTFMGPDTAFLVPYGLVPVGPDAAPYPADALWAQPDLTAAAGLMRTIFDDPEAARARGRAGQEDILKENGVVAAGARVRELALELTGWGA